jgi:hypothetical protein
MPSEPTHTPLKLRKLFIIIDLDNIKLGFVKRDRGTKVVNAGGVGPASKPSNGFVLQSVRGRKFAGARPPLLESGYGLMAGNWEAIWTLNKLSNRLSSCMNRAAFVPASTCSNFGRYCIRKLMIV